MPARIFCKVGELKGTHQDFTEEIVLGRSSKCSLQLNASMVSGRHIRIAYHDEPGVYVLEDMGSTNGTHLDGIRVREPQPLGHLHVITLAGTYNFIFQDLERCARRHGGAAAADRLPQPEEEPLQMRTMLQKVIPDLPSVITRLPEDDDHPASKTRIDQQIPIFPSNLAGTQSPTYEESPAERTSLGLELPLQLPDFLKPSTAASSPSTAPEMPEIPDTIDLADLQDPSLDAPSGFGDSQVAHLMLGGEDRTPPQGIELELLLADGTLKRFPLPEGKSILGRSAETALQVVSLEVSRQHAEFEVEGGQVRIRDLGSRNHTFVNNIETSGTVDIPPGASLGFGRLTGRLIYPPSVPDASSDS